MIDGLDNADALRRAQIAMLSGQPVQDVQLAERGASSAEKEEVEVQPAGSAVTTGRPCCWSPYIQIGNWL